MSPGAKKFLFGIVAVIITLMYFLTQVRLD